MANNFAPIFPGMDPFIENQRWQEFHSLLIARIAHRLGLLLVPLYSVQAETYLNIHLRPDVTITRARPDTEPRQPWTIQPDEADRTIAATLADIGDDQQRIEIRDKDGNLVTIIELLSPANKTRHRSAYQQNRNAILESTTHLVEIDLLRGGKRLETTLPAEGYATLICHAQEERCHNCAVFEIGLRDRLPRLPIPLLPEDGNVGLDLQAAFADVYQDLGYRWQLDYTLPLDPPPLSAEDTAWIKTLLTKAFPD
ncbi:DUF4058 family protein [Chloroflexota bacterium]